MLMLLLLLLLWGVCTGGYVRTHPFLYGSAEASVSVETSAQVLVAEEYCLSLLLVSLKCLLRV